MKKKGKTSKKTIIEKIGEREWLEIKRENKEIQFILGFIEENKYIIEDTKKYLSKIWKKRNDEEILEGGEEVDHNYNINI